MSLDELLEQNQLVRVTFTKDVPKLLVCGKEIGPFSKGGEARLRRWVAEELIHCGYAEPHRDELIDLVELQKISWRESIAGAKQLSTLPEGFYAKLKGALSLLKAEASTSVSKAAEYEKASTLARNVVDSRIRKIAHLATLESVSLEVLRALSPEERSLYESLKKAIGAWRSRALGEAGE